MEYSIIIPVYNTGSSLKELHSKITSVFSPISFAYEIIFIDDASTNEKTWNTLKNIQASDTKVKIAQLRYNHGQQKAILCGFMLSAGKYIITMDDDLQHPPEEIPKLIDEINKDEEIDVVIGTTSIINKKHGIVKNLGSFFVNKIDELILKKPGQITRGSFRIIRKEIANDILDIANNSPTIGSLIFAVTPRVKNIPVRHDKRTNGKSGYTFLYMVKLAIDNILNYSSLPLKLVAFLGIFYFTISLFIAGWVIYRKFIYGVSVPGWASLIVIQAISSGIIMAGIGIIGEYLIRIIKNTKGEGVKINIRRNISHTKNK